MNKIRLMFAGLIALLLGQAYGATEVELLNERTVDGEKKAYVIKALFQGSKSRYTFQTDKDALVGSGTYLLSLDGGKTIHYIEGRNNSCHHGPSEELLQITSGFMLKTTEKFKVKTSDGALHKVFEKDAEDMLGQPAKHIRINIGFTTSYKYMLFNDKYKVERLVDVWVSPKIEGINDQATVQKIWEYTGDEELDQALKAIIGTSNSFRLRSETEQTMVNKKGKKSSTQFLQYVKSITEIDDLPDEVFQSPECKEIDSDKMEKNFMALLKELLG